MIQISYLSRASKPMSAAEQLALLMQSRKNNATRGRKYSEWTMGFERVTDEGLQQI